MDLKYLRYFVAVAEELHFTRAAARLHMSQPPLSQMISRFEDELGFKVFERTKRKVILTEAGKHLLHESQSILARAQLAVDRARRASKGDIGHLSVAFVPWTDFTTVFSDIFRVYGARYPQVIVDFHSMSAPAGVAALGGASVDIAFLTTSARTEPPRDYKYELVASDAIKVVVPEDHRLVRKRVVRLKELADEPQIVVAHDRHGSFYQLADFLFRRAGLSMRVRYIIDHPQTTLVLVAAGAGVSLVPASYENVARPGVVYRPIRPTVDIQTIAAWNPTNSSPVLRAFLETLREVTNAGNRKGKSRV